VKDYLVQAMGINPGQVETRGYGQSKFLVPPRNLGPSPAEFEVNAEIARQQPNRRVIIVVHTTEG
jgi:outer membrane protein OmpA-like peptidoglycan-associated protein